MVLEGDNSGTAGARALDLGTEAGRAPLTVNPDAGEATNVDGVDGNSIAFARPRPSRTR